MSHIDSFQNHLDHFLPSNGKKCELFECTPGKIWLVLALLSIIGSATVGWQSFLVTVIWEIIAGWGIAWLCRGCGMGWIWAILIIFTGIPLALICTSMIFGKDLK